MPLPFWGTTRFFFLLLLTCPFAVASEKPPPRAPAASQIRFQGRWSGDVSQWVHPAAQPVPAPDAVVPSFQDDGAAFPSLLRTAEKSLSVPGFGIRPSIKAGSVPTSAASGDFNLDGIPDLAVANGWESTLWLYFGRPGGGFDLPKVIPLKGESPLSVEAVDLQDDGFLDLVVCEVDSSKVALLFGKEGGEFSEAWEYPVYARCGSTVSRDFDGDGVVDVLVGFVESYSGEIHDTFNILNALGLLRGRGDGTFEPLKFERSQQFFNVDRMIPTDLDGDSDLDLIVRSSLDGVFLAFNDGTGRFSRGAYVLYAQPLNPITDAVLGDLDGDGLPDLVLVFLGGQVFRFRQLPNRVFQQEPELQATGEFSLATDLLDVNGDGALDLVVVGSRMMVLKGDGRGNFGRAHIFRGEAWMVAMTSQDFDLDGDTDLVSINQSSDTLTLFENDGQGDFGSPRGLETSDSSIYGAGTSPGELRFGDLNEDGRLDALFIEVAPLGLPFRISVLTGGPQGEFLDPIRTPTFNEPLSGAFVLGDFRNTGHLDLVAVGQYENFSGSPYLAFAPGNGDGTFGATQLSRPEGASGLAVVGDFNRDGFLDVATAGNEAPGSYTLRVTLFLGGGDGTFSAGARMVFGGGGWPAAFHAADFNGDGNLDLLVWAYVNEVPYHDHALYELLGKGDGTFQSARKLSDLFRPFSVADLNGDNLPDLVTAKDFINDYPEPTKPEFEIFLCQQDGTFLKAHTYAPFSGITFFPSTNSGVAGGYDLFAPRLADFNGDGFIDIAAFQFGEGGYTWVQFLLGNGDGSFTTVFNSLEFGRVVAPQYTLDWNGDGFADLIEIGFSEVDMLPGGQGPGFDWDLLGAEVRGTRGYGLVQLARPLNHATTLSVNSNSPHLRVPERVEIPAGRLSAVFPFDIGAEHDWSRIFEIDVGANGHQITRRGWQRAPRLLYFPQVGNGDGGSLRFQTSLLLANTGDDARARIEFFDSDSLPLSLEVEGRGSSPVFDFSMKKGTSLSLTTPGTGPLQSGYARVTAFGDLGGTAVFTGIESRTGSTLFEAGVPMTQAHVSATVPVDSLGGYDTGTAIVNSAGQQTPPNAGLARVSLRFYDRQFEPLAEREIELPSGAHLARFASELFQGELAGPNRQGSFTIESDQPVAVVALRQYQDPTGSSPPGLTAFPVAADRADGPNFDNNSLLPVHKFVPQVGDGSDGLIRFQTSFIFVNTGVGAGINLDFFDSLGQPLALELVGRGSASHFFLSLLEGESVVVQTAGKGPIKVGYARIQTLRKVIGTAVFTGSEAAAGGRILYEAGIPLSQRLSDFTILVDSMGGRETGLALVNAGPYENAADAMVKLRLYDLSFRLLVEREIALPYGEHLARYVSQLFDDFPGASELQGVLTVSSTQPILAVTLRQDLNLDDSASGARPTLTAFPVIAGRADH